MLQHIIANLSAADVRYETLEGRDYVVVPTVMLTHGVHAGSQGPLYYGPDELCKNARGWDHKPIVVYHPFSADTAADPTILETQRIGFLLNTKYDKGKDHLRTESWIDIDKCVKVDNDILEAVENGTTQEVSTGLFADTDNQPGEWNDEKYVASAKNLCPDHLAVLPGMEGACSVADGAGLLRNEKSHSNLYSDLAAWVRTNMDPDEEHDTWLEDVFGSFFIYRKGDKLFKLPYTVSSDMVEVDATATPIEVKLVTEYRAVSDGSFVGNRSNPRHNETLEEPMEKTELVNALISNAATDWAETDRGWLSSLSLTRLQKMQVKNAAGDGDGEDGDEGDESNANDPPADPPQNQPSNPPQGDGNATPTNNAATPPAPALTTEQWLAAAPAGHMEVFNYGSQALQARRQELTTVITNSGANQFTDEQLAAFDLPTLENMAALAGQSNGQAQGHNPYTGQPQPQPTLNWGGAGGAPPTPPAPAAEKPMAVPVLNWGEKDSN